MAIYEDEERGTYYFIVRVPKVGGGYKQVKRRGFETQREARLAESKILIEFEEGILENENPSFEYVANEYLAWYKRRRKASSYTKVESIVRIHLVERFGKRKLKSIRNRDITRLQDDLLDDEVATSHIKKIHQILSAVFNFAIREEYTTINPARIVGNIDIEEKQHVNYWALEEFKQFLSVIDSDFYKTLFMTLYYSGMRKGELMALTWADIDFDNNIISIDKTVYNNNVTTPKTESSIRKIELPRHVMLMMSNLRASVDPKTGYIVFGEYYDHMSTTTLDRAHHKYIDKSQVKKIRLHDFRHSHASYLINKGAIPSIIARRLGHKDVATTLNTYSHLYPSTEKDVVLQMEDDFKIADVIQLKIK